MTPSVDRVGSSAPFHGCRSSAAQNSIPDRLKCADSPGDRVRTPGSRVELLRGLWVNVPVSSEILGNPLFDGFLACARQDDSRWRRFTLLGKS